MYREESLNEISDGKLYTENDIVRCDTGSCLGCRQVCCIGMGNTIVLDPLDVHRILAATGNNFEQLLKDRIEINMVDMLLLPNLKMGEGDACTFLDENKRCSIHQSRPSVCRLFPLGRYWEDETHYKYILQKGQCHKDNLVKTKVKKWFVVDEPLKYNEYVVLWHSFIKKVMAAFMQLDSSQAEAQHRVLCMYILKTFYITEYSEGRFYDEFKSRIKKAYNDLGVQE